MSMQDILKAREERWRAKTELAEKEKKTLLCITLRMPSDLRLSEEAKAFFRFAKRRFEEQEPRLTAHGTFFTPDGPYALYLTDECAEQAKRSAVRYEETAVYGDLCDIDVMTAELSEISRGEIGCSERKCFVCGRENARVCIREKAHAPEAVRAAVMEKLRKAAKEQDYEMDDRF